MFEGIAIPACIAAALGCFIGLEREWNRHFAGMRTHALVCLGACAFVHLSLDMHDTSTTRVMSQVASGLGFLGAGVILKDGLKVHGLTTAATIWAAGSVGCICGTEHYLDAIIVSWLIVLLNIFKIKQQT